MSIQSLIALAKQHNIKANRNRKNNIPYVRVMATFSQMASLLDSQNLSYEQVSVGDYPVTDAARFRDGIFKVLYTSGDVIMKVSPGGVVQKNLAPNNLGIENKIYSDSTILRQDIIAGLHRSGVASDTVISCINILDAVEQDTPITLTTTLLDSKDKSKITSDFGEVVLAFRRLVKEGGTILFPAASNQSDFDFYHNDIPISAKGDKGSCRYLIGGNKEISSHIDKLGDSNIERMFKAWHNRDEFGVFEHAAPDCPEINWWKQKLQGFTKGNILTYTTTHTWDEYVSDIQASQNGNRLGIPKPKNKSKYEQGDDNPLLFTLFTIWARYYTSHNKASFTNLARKMLKKSDSKIIFEFFNYDNSTGKVLISSQVITTYNTWDIRYHSNAANSKNNWPAIEGLK
jgi:hypothetical protein